MSTKPELSEEKYIVTEEKIFAIHSKLLRKKYQDIIMNNPWSIRYKNDALFKNYNIDFKLMDEEYHVLFNNSTLLLLPENLWLENVNLVIDPSARYSRSYALDYTYRGDGVFSLDVLKRKIQKHFASICSVNNVRLVVQCATHTDKMKYVISVTVTNVKTGII